MNYNLTKKIKEYHLLTKSYHVSNRHQKMSTYSKVVLGAVLPIAAVNFVQAQCQGAFMNGNDVAFGSATPLLLDVDGDMMNDLSFYTAAGNSYVKGLNGAMIFGTAAPGSYFSAKLFAGNDPIPGGAASATKATLAYSSGANGNWGNDGSGILGIVSGSGNFGFVSLNLNNATAPTDLSITQRGFNDDANQAITGGDCNSLPVELLTFEANANEEYVELTWTTASEVENAGFEVQRSENGKVFKTLSFIEGNGNSIEKQVYRFDDVKAAKGTTYYYRLRQIDFDGSFEYSEIISATILGKEAKATFAPNPVEAGVTQLEYVTTESGKLNLAIFDVVGKQLWSREAEVHTGTNALNLDLSHLASGIYFVKLKQGNAQIYEQIVIE